MAMNQPPQPGFTPQYQQQQGNGIAIASMVLGIISVVLCFLWFVGPILAILAVIFGALGLSKAKRVGRGRGAALAGLILGVIGIVLAIVFIVVVVMAVKSFDNYMTKGKKTEASLHLDMMERKIKTFHIEKSRLPVSTALTPTTNACESRTGKIPRIPLSQWEADKGWSEMQFHIDEDTLFQYRWTATDPTKGGYAEAIGDLDCDGTPTTYRVDFEVVEGMIRTTRHEPTPD
jgi:hypothetical protein